MRRRYRALYRLGITPWDETTPPAALASLIEGANALPAGHAVDLGCGTGHQSRYLHDHGWKVTAVDYAPEAITAARHRHSGHTIDWRVADVTRPHTVDPDGALTGRVALLLDNGCLHGISVSDRPGWAATVNTLAAPGATLILRAAPARAQGIGPRGIDKSQITALLIDHWTPQQSPAPNWHHYTHQR